MPAMPSDYAACDSHARCPIADRCNRVPCPDHPTTRVWQNWIAPEPGPEGCDLFEQDPPAVPDKNIGIGATIKAMRRAAGLTQAELAERVSMARTSITQIESGQQQLTLQSLRVIMGALGYSVRVEFEKTRGE